MRPGAKIGERFEVEREAGVGGMGRVFRARDLTTNALVAIKVLERGGARITRRFARESEVLAALRHPGIVEYIAHGTANGQPWLAMEWLDGEPLQRRLRRAGLTIAETVRLVRDAAAALGAAHQRGVVHRDVKPSNLFLVGRDLSKVKLLDFGVARRDRHALPLTASGEIIGTMAYMAPEQAMEGKVVDARADVYSLGVVLFESLTGRRPFDKATGEPLMPRILEGVAPDVRSMRADVPPPLAELIARSIARQREERLADGVALAAALDEIVAGLEEGFSDESLTSGEHPLRAMVVAQDVPPTIAEGELRTVVEAHGGVLARNADATLVATFSGGPSLEADASRAAQASLAIQQLGTEASLFVATGRGAPDGDIEVTRGEIRVDKSVAALLSPRFAIDRSDGALFLRAGGAFVGTPTLLGRETKFVGRDRELRLLETLFEECLEGAARVVVVTGEAGSGKSRLVIELLASLRSRPDAPLVLSGGGEPVGAGSPFALISQAVRRAAGIEDGDPLDLARGKLTDRIGRVIADAERASRVVALLGELARVPFEHEAVRATRHDSTKRGDAMRGAFEDWLAAESATKPVVLVLEDLHWGDLPTVRFVDSALRVLSGARLFILALARPEVHERFPSLFAERNRVEVTLGRLTARASAALVRQALGDRLPATAIDGIVARAEGNAFYLEQLIQSVAERGPGVGVGGDGALPDSVLGTVEARYRALDDDVRIVLRAASVFGETFVPEGVRALLRGRAIDAALETLEQREIVERRPGEGAGVLAFRHHLLREAAYAAMTEEDRRTGHRLGGEWLERTGAGDPLTLAEHFERGGEALRAAPFYRRAAEQALDGNDFDAVLARVDRGLACQPDRELRGELWALSSEAHAARGDFITAVQAGQSALERFELGTISWFRTVARLCIVYSYLGDRQAVETWARRAGAVTPTRDVGHVQLACLCRAIGPLYDAGRNSAAEELLTRATEIAEALEPLDRVERGWVHIGRYWKYYVQDDMARATHEAERIVWAFSVPGEERALAVSRTNLAFALTSIGEFQRAEEELRKALAAAERMGIADVTASTIENLGFVLLQQGRLEEAREMLDRAVGIADALRSVRLAESAKTYLSMVYLRAGDPLTAEQLARFAVDHRSGNDTLHAEALAALARALLDQGRAAEALEVTERVDALAFDPVSANKPGILLIRAEALWANGEHAQADRTIVRAREALEARAARFTDDEAKQSFFERVPVHRRIVELEREWNAHRAG